MKMLQITKLNPQLVKLLENDIELKNKDLKTLYSIIFNRFYDFSDGYKYYLAKNNLCEVEIVYVNLPLINKLEGIEKLSLEEKCEYYIKKYRPDIIFDQGNSLIKIASYLKNKFSFIKIISTWDGYIKTQAAGFAGYDIYFTCVNGIKNKYKKNNSNCQLNPFGFDTRILEKIEKPTNKINKICFAGSIITAVHSSRLSQLQLLNQQHLIEFYIGNLGQGIGINKTKIRELIYGNFSKIVNIYNLEYKNKGGLFGLSMYNMLQNYTAVLNIHGDDVNEIGNMRTTEAGGIGACQIIDYKHNANDYYKPDYEAVYYKTDSELIDKAKYLINNPNEALKIGKNAQRRTLQEHTMEMHVLRFWDYLKPMI